MNLLRPAPGGREGRILGIRPEHLNLDSEGWALAVDTVELLGAKGLVHTRLDDETLIVRTQDVRTQEHETAPAVGSTVHVRPREDRLHWFDADTGQRIAG
jgi:sn-glycerol 3-phosphate transport system ATP-binding protein